MGDMLGGRIYLVVEQRIKVASGMRKGAVGMLRVGNRKNTNQRIEKQVGGD